MADKQYYAVLDTNVLVSALFNDDSVPGQILRHALSTEVIVPILNQSMLDEYKEVLSRDKFHFHQGRVRKILRQLWNLSKRYESADVTEPMPDPDDVVFYAVTLSAREDYDAQLVTGNTRHLPQTPFVVTPREMLDIVEGRRQAE